jgi:beta-glucanase (GH16 family)
MVLGISRLIITPPKSKIKTEEQLRQTIKDEWLKTRDGINNIDIQLMHSNGWITYITKEMKNGNMECVDWQNCHIPYAALSL